MSKGAELEQAILDAIERTLKNEKDVEEAKRYFANILVNDMINESQKVF